MRWVSLGFALSLVLAGSFGCRKRQLESSASGALASSSAHAAQSAVVHASAIDSSRLPEDPALGQRSTAQWREHMAEEERERRLGYDKRKLKQHRAVLAFLSTTREGYDRASTRAAVLERQKALSAALSGQRERIEKIDHWGVNSNLLADYAAQLQLLSEPYPAARIAALSGDSQLLEATRAEFDARVKKMTEWLERAAESEDE